MIQVVDSYDYQLLPLRRMQESKYKKAFVEKHIKVKNLPIHCTVHLYIIYIYMSEAYFIFSF